MGVVIKQSFWGTAISYVGVLIAFFNTLYIRPQFFLMDKIGLFGIITANAMMISSFTSFGMASSYIKFFPAFSEKDRNSALTFQVFIVVAGCLIVLSLAYLFRGFIIERYIESAPEYINYLSITAVIIVVNSLFEMFFSYSRTILKVLFPSFLRDVFLRICAIFLVVGYAADWFSFEWAIKGLAVNYSMALILLLGKIMLVDGFRFSFNFKILSNSWKKKLYRFSAYSMMMAGSFAVMNNVTYDLVLSNLGSAANGIFITCFFIGTIVELPRRNMAKVISPILSVEMTSNNMAEVESLYKRSSITMSLLGTLFFIGILTNLQDLFLFIPQGDKFSDGIYVVILVCSAKLLVMISSFPAEIINFSDRYKYNLIFQLIAAILLISLSSFMIPVYGLNGAALSYFLVITLHVVAKLAYVKYQFKIQPFAKSHFTLLIVSLVTFTIAYLFNIKTHPILLIFLRSVLTTIAFILMIYKLKISPDINKLIHSTFERFFKINLPK